MVKKEYESGRKPDKVERCSDRPAQRALSERTIYAVADPESAAYVESLKKKYKKYAMPLDQARKVVDAAMGDTRLTDLLYEARE